MSTIEERILIYIALAVVCALVGVFAGMIFGALTFLQIAAVIEALFWFGMPKPGASKHRQHRILFNH
jgi:ABC-type microcin C transport system permease subunit YejE